MDFIGRLNCALRRRNSNARPLIRSHPCCWDDEEVRVEVGELLDEGLSVERLVGAACWLGNTALLL
jgi:hypothetical protein